MSESYDIIVIGGGHAGAEAAWAAARMGANTALVTMSHEAIGRMSCNPAIGGIGKGQMVREIDALGGLMGLAADAAGIQFRMLNRRKGPAVWAPRTQADRTLYATAVQELLDSCSQLSILEGIVEELVVEEVNGSPAQILAGRGEVQSGGIGDATSARTEVGDPDSIGFHGSQETAPSRSRLGTARIEVGDPDSIGVRGSQGGRTRIRSVVLKDGRRLSADAVIITTGTFMRGLMHCGTNQTRGGRVGEASAEGISGCLQRLGFELGRLKTGTPPRLCRDSINYGACEIQHGDEIPMPFSFMNDSITNRQINCWITYTNPQAHGHIHENLHRAPMYSGQIASTGPRYCPSIEDKIVRFADKNRHQVFLEPEGYDSDRVYCNGISTSLPADVQEQFVRCISGLEQARIVQHGYAVEYDFVPTHQTTAGLQTKSVQGLFLAGQINGTSGYEEAGAQGLIAGINAVRWLRREEPITLGRDAAYIGVMIDDLITKPPTEPYRMFTSRAEYRLRLRSDNADQRLTPLGRELGLVCDKRWDRFQAKRNAVEAVAHLCRTGAVDGQPIASWMRRPDADLPTLCSVLNGHGAPLCVDHVQQVLTDAKYSGYEQRQSQQIERFRRLENMPIPMATDFAGMRELRAEAREQLTRVAPRTLGQASRITGITPSDITVVWIYLTGRRAG